MKTNRPLGTRQREAAIAARTPTQAIGRGEEVNVDQYDSIVFSEVVTNLVRPDAECNWRDEHDEDIQHPVRVQVYLRSSAGGDHRQCEARMSKHCTGFGQHLHHRKLRRHGDHRPCNLIDVCLFCHHDIHAAPAMSYKHGWMVRTADDPATTPLTDLRGGTSMLA